MAEDVRVVLTLALLSSIIGPVVLLVFNRFFSRPHDRVELAASLQDIADQAVAELQREREENERLRRQMADRETQERGAALDITIRIRDGNPPRIEGERIERVKPGTGPLVPPAEAVKK